MATNMKENGFETLEIEMIHWTWLRYLAVKNLLSLANYGKIGIGNRGGKDKLFDFFVGNVMKNTRGKANPVITKDILHKKLDN